ncbi:hypothetical protein [Nisaea nitritireducens]|uniref:hypothetical protein n=1 Tax=Nisaea nitritireducens TaxID=568392 RepID=UPI001867F505|nr:hypothetical protein [Nisaea nitritireducens]
MSNSFISDLVKERLEWFQRGIVIIAIISTLFTYNGAAEAFEASDWYGKSMAAALALASGVMIWLIWRTLFRSAVHERNVLERSAALIKTAIGMSAIMAASTWFMVSGFAKDHIDAIQMRGGIAAAERYTAEIHRHALAVGHLKPQIAGLSSELARYSELERKEGVSTGIGGSGAVERELGIASENLARLIDTIEATLDAVDLDHKEAMARIAGMRKIANDRMRPMERWQKFDAKESAWRTEVVQIDATDAVRAAIASLEATSRDLGAVVVLSGSAAIAAKQREAFARYQSLIKQRAAPIIEAARSQLMKSAGEPPVFEKVGVAIGVILFWKEFAGFWVLGLGIDFAAPLIMLISIHVMTATMTARQAFISKVLNVTTEEKAVRKASEAWLRQFGLDDESSGLIDNVAIGYDPNLESEAGEDRHA